MHFLHRIIPSVCALLGMLLLGLPAAIWLSRTGFTVFCIAGAAIGGLAGLWADALLSKRLSREAYRSFVHLTAAVMVLITVICGIAGLLAFGRSMNLL